MRMGRSEHNPLTLAWESALCLHRRGWWSYALHLCHDPDDAEDLLHDALTSILERNILPDEVAPGYVYRVMRNARISRGRREKTRRAHAPRLAPHSERCTTPDVRGFDVALASLTDDQREVITLKHAGGLTLEQIALATGRPLGTVAGQHRRAIESLRTALMNREESEV